MSQKEAFRFNIKLPLCDFLYSLPVTLLHRLVKHSLQQWASLIEIIDLLLEVIESLPLFQSFGKFAAPVEDGV